MTFNYFIQCPVCDTVTRMRSPGGYIYKTPVRIHCGKCNTLLTGSFISDSDNGKTYYSPDNCREVTPRHYDYYGEASGEVLCRKITYLPDEGLTIPSTISPAMAFLMSIDLEERDDFINYACHLTALDNNWDKERILFDLYRKGKDALLKDRYSHVAVSRGYNLDNKVSILCYVYYCYFSVVGGVFTKRELTKKLQALNYEINHIDRTELFSFMTYLQKEDRLQKAQEKMFDAMNSFVGISSYLVPALGAMRYREPDLIDKSIYGLSTCSFDDIRIFYLDAFEDLSDFCDIILGLNNIKYRNHYNSFGTKLNMEKLMGQKKGNRVKLLSTRECFSSLFALRDDSNELRNAIGHKNANYEGIEQTIEYIPNIQKPSDVKNAYLLDVAIQCIELMQSSVMLSMIIYKLLFLLYRDNNTTAQLHPIFYTGVKSSSRCPCGSGLPYRRCCKPYVSKYKKGYKAIEIGEYANTAFDLSNIE